MLWMMFGRQVLPPSRIVRPIGDSRSGEIKPGWNLAPQGVPGLIDVRRPDDGSIPLYTQISIARKNQRAAAGLIFAKAIIQSARMKQRIHIEVLRPGTHVEVGSARR